jgi:TonB family protein
MKFSHIFRTLVFAFLATVGQSVARAQSDTPPQKQDSTSPQETPPKLIKSTVPVFPEEALRKNIEGKVLVRIVVDANGRVSDVKPLSGPSELIQSALDNAKQWQFEPPAHAPFVTTAEIRYGFPKECPGPVSDFGEVMGSGRLLNKEGKVVAAPDGENWTLPPYFEEDRKAGIAGKMLLSVSLDAAGNVKEIHVVKSLSPHLDEAAVETVRTWKFRLIDGNLNSLRNDYELRIDYRATCHAEF